MIKNNIISEFKLHGIAESTLVFLPTVNNYNDHLEQYNLVDIALDTFPYGGTTTTCEALMMGVPVITLVGKLHAQRVSYSILENIGFTSTITFREEEYIHTAVKLATRPDELDSLRTALPLLLQRSIIGQPQKFTRQLEELYLDTCLRKGIDLSALNNVGVLKTDVLTMNNDISIVVPHTLEETVTYILTEQDDWYEDEIRFLRRIAKPGMRVLDIQAGYGCYALSLASLTTSSGSVLALESNAKKRTCIRESAQHNGFDWLTIGEPDDASIRPFIEEGVDIIIAPEEDDAMFTTVLKLLEDKSPLIMAQAMRNTGLDVALSARMREQGYTAYRLIPGLELLAPLPEGFAPLSWHRQVFFCKPEHAVTLHDGGWLVLHELATVNLPENDTPWTEMLHARSYAHALLPLWEQQRQQGQEGEDWPTLRNALNAYALAHNTDQSPDQRYAMLNAALSILGNMPDPAQKTVYLCTLARIQIELGAYDFALTTLETLKHTMEGATQFVPDQPFLTLGTAYDASNFSQHIDNWIFAQVLTVSETLRMPTSMGSNTQSLRTLNQRLMDLQFPDTSMEKRLATAIKRHAASYGRSVKSNKFVPQRCELEEKQQLDRADGFVDAKRWSEQVQQCHKQWQKSPDKIALISEIKELRSMFANYCTEVNLSQVTQMLQNGANTGVCILLQGNIRYEPLTDDEKRTTASLVNSTDLKNGRITPKMIVPCMLYFLPHEMHQCNDFIRFPDIILDLYLDFMLLPVCYFRYVGEVELYSIHMHRWVDYIHKNVVRSKRSWIKIKKAWQKIGIHFLEKASFISMYQTSGSLKNILVQRADIMEKVLQDGFGHSLAYQFPPRPSGRQKIRLGILAAHYMPQSETYGLLPWYEEIDKNRFEIILFSTVGINHPLAEYCSSRADEFVVLQGDITSMVGQIRAYDLDILLLGTNVSAVTHTITLLALYHLARIQVASPTGGASTGMRYWKYMLHGDSIITKEIQDNCREIMIPIMTDYISVNTNIHENAVTDQYSRDTLGIPDRAIVYVSSSSVFKITPEIRQTWATIIASVPDAYLILCPFNPNWTSSHPTRSFSMGMEQIFRNHGVGSDRLRVLATHGSGNIRNLFRISDIYLDSYVCSGGTSIMDCIETEIVPLVLRGNTLANQTAARILGNMFEDIFAETPEEYERLAIQLGVDTIWRMSVRNRIIGRKKLAETDNYVKMFGNAIGTCLYQLAQKQLYPFNKVEESIS